MLRFIVTEGERSWQAEHAAGPVEFGRGSAEPGVRTYAFRSEGDAGRVRFEEITPGLVRVANLSTSETITANDGDPIGPGLSAEVSLPAFIRVGGVLIEIEVAAKSEEMATLSSAARAVRVGDRVSLRALGTSPAPEELARWLETVVDLHKSAVGSTDFYEQAARSLVDLIGLDRGLVLLRADDQWEVKAKASRHRTTGIEFSTTILDEASEQGLTLYEASTALKATESLVGVEAVVASPIFGDRDRVIGAVYGARLSGLTSQGIGPLEAQVVQLLATALGSSLALFEQQRESSRLRVQFEQFFSETLAHELQRNPRLLEGQEREVTVLFSDIRGFSRLSERLSARETCQLVGDVMERLSARIRDHGGVVVDYVGDGLLAMWNAPADQPDHALLACRAALAMQAELPGLDETWRERIGRPLGLGIGLNTGPALVGNTGSRVKFKYGPLGHTVNLASRVEGATKQLGVPILITGSTRAALRGASATRRLCCVRVVGIAGAVNLHELHAELGSPEWLGRRDLYEEGLVHYEAGRWDQACRTLYPLLSGREGKYDRPTLALVGRSIECLQTAPDPFDPVVELGHK